MLSELCNTLLHAILHSILRKICNTLSHAILDEFCNTLTGPSGRWRG